MSPVKHIDIIKSIFYLVSNVKYAFCLLPSITYMGRDLTKITFWHC